MLGDTFISINDGAQTRHQFTDGYEKSAAKIIKGYG